MYAEENKALVREAIDELFNKGNLAIVDRAYAPTYVSHDPANPGPLSGPESVRQFVAMQRKAFPDLRTRIEDQIAEGDKVVTRWAARGTHQGELMGIPPTGKTVTITGIIISRIAGGRIVEDWNNYDLLGMLQQLGVVPLPSGGGR